MKIARVLGGMATAGAATASAFLLLASTASAGVPTNLVDPYVGYAAEAHAFNLSASGLINIPKTYNSDCSVLSHDAHGIPLLTTGVATLKLLTSSCKVNDDGTATSTQSVASASLLGGKITVGAIVSTCTIDANGKGTVGSVVGTLNGLPLSKGSGTVINVPGVASVIINENKDVNGAMTSNAVHVSVKAVVLLGHTITPAQDIIVGQCGVSGYGNILD